MKCQRLRCDQPATHEVYASFWSGNSVEERLCHDHALRMHEALLAKPETRSGWMVPLRRSA